MPVAGDAMPGGIGIEAQRVEHLLVDGRQALQRAAGIEFVERIVVRPARRWLRKSLGSELTPKSASFVLPPFKRKIGGRSRNVVREQARVRADS